MLYKRKPVRYEPIPQDAKEDADVRHHQPTIVNHTEYMEQTWVIEETAEIFVDYEKFLNRYEASTCDVAPWAC